MTTVDDTLGAMFADPRTIVKPRPRVRGLRMPALPSWPLVAQVAGGLSALGGVYLEWGTAVTLIVGGVTSVVIGALREAGKI
jgi:hypothetical protein